MSIAFSTLPILCAFSCLNKQQAKPVNKFLERYYHSIASKKDKDITPMERFVVRSTFHHMTAVGDILYPEAAIIVRSLTLMDIPSPQHPNRKTRTVQDCVRQRKPRPGDTIVPLPSAFFKDSAFINKRVRRLPVGIHYDAFSGNSPEAKRMRYAYNPVCYEISKTAAGKKQVRAYIWMNWSRSKRVKTDLHLGPFSVDFPDSLIYVAGKATPYYAQVEWVLP